MRMSPEEGRAISLARARVRVRVRVYKESKRKQIVLLEIREKLESFASCPGNPSQSCDLSGYSYFWLTTWFCKELLYGPGNFRTVI